jgi:hypothetical protein
VTLPAVSQSDEQSVDAPSSASVQPSAAEPMDGGVTLPAVSQSQSVDAPSSASVQPSAAEPVDGGVTLPAVSQSDEQSVDAPSSASVLPSAAEPVDEGVTLPAVTQSDEQPVDAASTTPSTPGQPSVTQSTPPGVLELLHIVSPLPKCQVMRKRKRAAESSAVLTSTTYKEQLMEKTTAKSKATNKAKGDEKLSFENAVVAEDKGSKKGSSKSTSKTKAAKKKTCRDGRRPAKKRQSTEHHRGQNVGNTSEKGKKKALMKVKRVQSSKSAARFYCLMCNELFIEPPTENWIQCRLCKGWCHEACTDGETSRGFVCDFCR